MSPYLAATSQHVNDLPIWIAAAIVAGFIVIFPLFWCLVVLLISRIGDWHRLAAVYAAGERTPSGAVHRGLHGMVGLSRYKSMLTVHLAQDGFFIEVPPFFRVGHPRLFIPWSAISQRAGKRILMRDMTALTIGQPPVGSVTLALPDNLLRPA